MFLSACFVIPNCCVCLTHFFLGVRILIYMFRLLGTDKFDVLWTCIVIILRNKYM